MEHIIIEMVEKLIFGNDSVTDKLKMLFYIQKHLWEIVEEKMDMENHDS